jgi:exopolyphosphatase/guanosine-5'-triphosphate,3'-diphosphate pyrophosphatase
MIIDIGGGSTELAFREGRELVAHSMQLGCVRVTEAHLGRDAASATMIANAQVMIDAEIQRLFRVEPKFESARGAVSLVGLAGTIATLAQLDVGLREYQREVVHHHVLTRDVVEHWIDVLAGESAAERLSHPGMVEGREDVLLGGLLVLRRVMHEFGVSSLLSSECDILDGVAAQLQGRVQGSCRESN